jgi:ribonuclease J
MKITIHRGCAEIGGTCVEISDDGRSILLDLGLPLDKDALPTDVTALHPDAVLVSHPHQDHFGLIETLGGNVPVYLGQLSHDLIDAPRLFREDVAPVDWNIKHIDAWDKFDVAGFTVTPYLVDHSTPEAFAFLIEKNGERIFYSGDFRGHGRKNILFKKLLKRPPKNIDALIMEWTMIGRDNHEFPTETDVEKSIISFCKSHDGATFVVCSGQNVDRLVSAYRACLQTEKILVIDLYTAWVLEKVKRKSSRMPQMSWDKVRVSIPGYQYDRLKSENGKYRAFLDEAFKSRIKIEDIEAAPNLYLNLVRPSAVKYLRLFQSKGPINIIYSQWSGYLEDEFVKKGDWPVDMVALRDELAERFAYIHTSGHAVEEDLKALVDALKPKALIPVHTERGDAFEELFGSTVNLNDGEGYDLLHE